MFVSIKGEELYYRDINLEIYKKINKRIQVTAILAKQSYNKDVLEGKTPGTYGVVESTIAIADISYISSIEKMSIELQELLCSCWGRKLEYGISRIYYISKLVFCSTRHV